MLSLPDKILEEPFSVWTFRISYFFLRKSNMKFYRKSREGSGLKWSSFSMLHQGESNINFYTAILYIIQCVPKQPASFFSKASSNFTGIKWANIFIKPRLIPHHLASKFSKSIHWFRSYLNFNSAGRFSRNSVSRLVVHGEKIMLDSPCWSILIYDLFSTDPSLLFR